MVLLGSLLIEQFVPSGVRLHPGQLNDLLDTKGKSPDKVISSQSVPIPYLKDEKRVHLFLAHVAVSMGKQTWCVGVGK